MAAHSLVTSMWAIWTGVLCLHAATSFTRVVAQEVDYDYTDGPNGPAHWGDLKPEWSVCKTGRKQSPLAISTENMVTDTDLKKLDATYPESPVPANISNNGHTVELNIPDGAVVLKINGVKYKSTQIHFHYPSEHTILNYTFALEAHQVHVSDDGKIAVVGWLFALGGKSSFLDQFFNNLPAYESDTPFPIPPIKLLSMKGSYGRYTGSLTTPPCSENVTWTLMLWDFPTVSAEQMAKLKLSLPHPNARPTFPSNGRKFYITDGKN